MKSLFRYDVFNVLCENCFVAYYKTLGDFIPERDQFYFELKSGDDTFLLGSKDMLICLRLLEKLKEIKKIDEGWWVNMTSLYGDEILMVEYEDVPPEQSDNT